jgi:hypothetical protein
MEVTCCVGDWVGRIFPEYAGGSHVTSIMTKPDMQAHGP